MKAVILAGGFGKRLRPITNNIPKPLIEVKGKPIIVRQIEWLKIYNIDEIVVCVGYLKEKIIEYLGSGRKLGVKIIYSVEDEPLGTGGALKNAEPVLNKENMFLVVNGDIITNLNPLKMLRYLDTRAIGVIAVHALPSPYGVLEIDKNNFITEFKEKPYLYDYWINAGVYLFDHRIFKFLPEKGDIERTTFVELAKAKRLRAVKYSNVFWKSIDTHKDIEEVEKIL